MKKSRRGKKLRGYVQLSTDDFADMILKQRGVTFCRIYSRTIPKMNQGGKKGVPKNPFLDHETKTSLVVKDSILVAMVGFDYENTVNNRRSKEAILLAKKFFKEEFGMDNSEIEDMLGKCKKSIDDKIANFEAKERGWGKHMQALDDNNCPIFELKKVKDDDGNIVDKEMPVLSKLMIDHTKTNGEYNRYLQVCPLSTKKPVYKWADNLEPLTPEDVELMKTYFTKKSSNANHQGVEKEIRVRDYMIENILIIHMNNQRFEMGNFNAQTIDFDRLKPKQKTK